MPYGKEVTPDGIAVLNTETGEVIGRHEDESSADAQIRALYANESKSTGVEIDALKVFDMSHSQITAHDHKHEVKSFVATPRYDPTLMERFRSLFKTTLKPGMYLTDKDEDGLRYMLIITSNSYTDRDDETITSQALKAYEESCYPGDGLYHNDNPLLFWHTDAFKMGTIEAVDYIEPFLLEIAKEAPTRMARVLWDYAEQQGDKAGASHRFGYLDEDRQPDGDYERIFKQETSYLPERELAANLMTYSGVIDKMSTQRSDARFNDIFSAATGGKIKDAAEQAKADAGKFEKALAELGINHKAKADMPPDENVPVDSEPDDAMPPEEAKETPAEFAKYLDALNQIYALIMALQSGQGAMDEAVVELAKQFNAEKAAHAKEKAAGDSLSERIAAIETALKMKPRSVQRDGEATDVAKLLADLGDAQKEAADSGKVDSMFGKIKPPLKYDKFNRVIE